MPSADGMEREIGAGTLRRLAADVGVWRGWKWPKDECEAKRNGRCCCGPGRRIILRGIASTHANGANSLGYTPPARNGEEILPSWLLAGNHKQNGHGRDFHSVSRPATNQPVDEGGQLLYAAVKWTGKCSSRNNTNSASRVKIDGEEEEVVGGNAENELAGQSVVVAVEIIPLSTPLLPAARLC